MDVSSPSANMSGVMLAEWSSFNRSLPHFFFLCSTVLELDVSGNILVGWALVAKHGWYDLNVCQGEHSFCLIDQYGILLCVTVWSHSEADWLSQLFYKHPHLQEFVIWMVTTETFEKTTLCAWSTSCLGLLYGTCNIYAGIYDKFSYVLGFKNAFQRLSVPEERSLLTPCKGNRWEWDPDDQSFSCWLFYDKVKQPHSRNFLSWDYLTWKLE